ncbi:MAG: DUF3071 domain-containing protein [Actinomycetales bacterium]|nr:DUF3071 domain-containing protein [Actinomycetales bacterium]
MTGQSLETTLQTFSPREVQARVRAGESPDVIAAESGWPMDKVMRYAEPLLAERSFIAEQAQRVEVRRSGGGATLLQSAYDAVGGDPEAGTIAWDAYRREDGKWIVTASYTDADGSHLARWTYDHAGRNLHPLDDDARTLLGARPAPARDEDVDIAEALDLVADVPVVREAESRPRLVAVPDAVDESDEAEDADEPAGGPDEDEADRPSASGPADQTETMALPHPSLLDDEAVEEPAKAVKPTRQSKKAQEPVEPKPAPAKATRKPRAKKGRASVPSWDEILFGATKHDD